jgi:hypothetical protein
MLLCYNPSLGLTTKAKGSQVHGPRRVWEWRFTLPNELSFWELESRCTPEPSESDCKGQNTHIEEFFVSLKIYWSVNVWNGLAWLISTFATQVMAKRKVGSQTGSLTPDHKKSWINPKSVCVNGVQYTVEKISTKATTFL